MNKTPNPRLQPSASRASSAVLFLALLTLPIFTICATFFDFIFGDCYACYVTSYLPTQSLSDQVWAGYVSALPYGVLAALLTTLNTYVAWRYLPIPNLFAQIFSVVFAGLLSFSLFYEDTLVMATMCITAWVLQWLNFGITVRRV